MTRSGSEKTIEFGRSSGVSELIVRSKIRWAYINSLLEKGRTRVLLRSPPFGSTHEKETQARVGGGSETRSAARRKRKASDTLEAQPES